MSALRALAGALLGFLAGCAALQPAPDSEVQACERWYAALDRAVDSEGVRDGQQARIAGFPYLRVDRFHASLRERAGAAEPALQAYADALLQLDLLARRHELRTLRRPPLPPHEAYARTTECGRLLREVDLAKPQRRAQLLERAVVPDDYSALRRAIGLYPLTRLFFARGVRQWQSEVRAAFASAPRVPEGALLVRYAPPAAAPIGRAEVGALLAGAARDPLGRPQLSRLDLERIAAAYAPSFEIAVRADHDRFGALRWRRDSETPQVDGGDTVVYFSTTHTRYRRGAQDRILLQLVYTLWFPERPPLEEGDLLSGALDGLVWRVTLAPDGEPILYDSIHPCGCFHQFFPTPRARPRPAPNALEEWAFVPHALPRVAEGERPRVRLASATHSIEGLSMVRGADSLVRYALRDYDELRSLQLPQGGYRSPFDAQGLIHGTERAERMLFWPMGIASAGAMRQWGRQPTAFVGRRHFDDADLVERRFDLDLDVPES